MRQEAQIVTIKVADNGGWILEWGNSLDGMRFEIFQTKHELIQRVSDLLGDWP